MHIAIFIIPILVGGLIQIIKLVIDKIKGDKINFDKLFVSGGFPSVHSGLSTSLLVSVGYVDGINSTIFAVTLIFSILFWYDASNVRYQAGKHAEVINNMRNQLSDIFKLEYQTKIKGKLKERLGHTFGEVIGGIIISAILTIIIIYILKYYGISFN